ncbi:hypothetical protein [Aliivibrio fischeri]|uniref:hypothetical protein n=1 Tax=Aliivibrio fischeri TaxID=668 RepID=UPI0007C46811|nr:hypothetical protein [Aliivibrio fischeri]
MGIDIKKHPEVTEQEVREEILKHVDDTTSFNCLQFDSLEQAIDKLAKMHCLNINNFTEMDQETIDEQTENNFDNLYGVKVGELVWGDNEVWVSESVISDWANESSQRLGDAHNCIEDIAAWVENSLIEGVLSVYNKGADR